LKHNNVRLASLSRRLDPLWWLIARMLRLKPHATAPAVPRSILLVELHLLGDMVMLIPLLRVIRRHHPDAHVGLLAGPWARDILESTGLVDEFIMLRAPWVAKGQGLRGMVGLMRAIRTVRSRTWDWGIDVRGDVRNALLLALSRAKRRVAYDFTGGAALLTDVVPDDGVLRHIIEHHEALALALSMPMTADERIPTLRFNEPTESAARASRRRVGLHFGASLALRRMPLQEARALLSSLRDNENADLILVDSPEIHALNTALIQELPAQQAGRIERWRGSLNEFVAFLATLDEFYAMDSGPAHLAAALGVHTTVFFGPHLSRAVRPMGSNVSVVERDDIACRPCDQHRCTNVLYQQCLTQLVGLQSRH
jgi:ADP-heptose:LPS heptosyltransferase